MNPVAEEGPLRIGSRFQGKYEIVGHLGSGGQAWVYRGLHLVTRREVAIKVIHSPYGVTREMRERGEKEARALGLLNHPNVVAMHDAGITDDGIFFIVMELLRGRSLRATLLAHPRLEIEEVLALAIQAGEALQVAHGHGIIHRDFKPDNTFLVQGNVLKVIDFGIAKILGEIGFTTRKEVVLGSILYMSPEQAQGHTLTPRSDICALGLIMYEALIGKHPTLLVFERELLQKHEPYRKPTILDIPPLQVFRLPPMLSDLDPSIPLYIAQVVQRALAKKAEQRFATMAAFVESMRECLALYLRDTPAERRAIKRDLSLVTSPTSDPPPSSHGANGTEVMKPVGPAPRSFPAAPIASLNAVTALTGTALASASSNPPAAERPTEPPPRAQVRTPIVQKPPQEHVQTPQPQVPPRQQAVVPQPAVDQHFHTREQVPTRSSTAPTRRSQAPTIPSRSKLSAPRRVTAPPVTVGSRQTGRRVAAASAAAPERRWSAVVGGCLFGATVGTFGMLAYFDVPLFAAARLHEAPSITRSVAAPSPSTPSLASTAATAPLEPGVQRPDQPAPALTRDPPPPTPAPVLGSSPPKARAATAVNRPSAVIPSNSASPIEQVPTVRPKTRESIY
jgi:serine/threonine protein kinase